MSPDEYERAVAAATALATTIARDEGYADPQAAWGQCTIASDRLAETLAAVPIWRIRVVGMNFPGREHWASIVPRASGAEGQYDVAAFQGAVIDLTCRQFDPGAPVVFVGTLGDWLDNCCEWLVDGVLAEVHLPGEGDAEPVWRDFHVRDDIEPGPLVYPWQACASR